MKKILFTLTVAAILCSCNVSESKEQKPAEQTKVESQCNCSDRDAGKLAFKMIDDFNQTQNAVSSQYARVMNIAQMPSKTNDCTWYVKFKISYPFGNTDGMHPDQFIEKRILCDGQKVYVP
jgi:hypothetical protein